MKKCKLVQNIRNFKFCYFIFCIMICLVVFPVSTSAQENSDHVIRVGSFEETYNVVNEKGERSGYGYEYLQDIAGYAGWTYKYITSDWKNCFTQLENGEIDISWWTFPIQTNVLKICFFRYAYGGREILHLYGCIQYGSYGRKFGFF